MFEKPEFSAESREPGSVDQFVAEVESAKRAYRERLSKNISESERKDLEHGIREWDRVVGYFKGISSRMNEGRTFEEILAEDREKLKTEEKAAGEGGKGNAEGELSQEAILRMAELAVQNAREKKNAE